MNFGMKALVGAIGCVVLANPALAQDGDEGRGQNSGFWVGAVLGGEKADLGRKKDRPLYGVGAGYDFGLGNGRLGVEVEATDSSSGGCSRQVDDNGDTLCYKAGRDLYAGVRAGVVVAPQLLIYAKGGYVNGAYRVELEDGAAVEKARVGGWRAGVGVERDFGSAYVRVEYRYSDYTTAPAAVYAEMGSYDSPRVPAPQFDLGMAPAGSLYTSPNDLAKFARIMIRRGSDGQTRLLRDESLQQMWTPQSGDTLPRVFGLGFVLGNIDGHRTVGHTGGIYGFSTNLLVLPDDGFAVMAFGSLDDNPLARRFAQYAAKVVLAAKSGQPLPQFEHSKAIAAEEAAALAGTYRNAGSSVTVKSLNGRTLLEGGGRAAEVRKFGRSYLLDDANSYSNALSFAPDRSSLTLDGTRYDRAASDEVPADAPDALKAVIGEYGWDHELIRIFEKDGAPWIQIEWTGWQPMRVIDNDRWAFPDDPTGLYPKEQIRFVRDASGSATAIDLNGIIFKRRNRGLEALQTVRQLAKNRPNLKADALRATPPSIRTERASDLIEIAKLDPAIKLQIAYATSDNFVGFPVYDEPRAFAQRPVAEALQRVNRKLSPHGFGLTIRDAYRPWYVTKMFWDATPPEAHLYVADPSQGSRHNRGAAIDLTLHDLSTGKMVEMPGWYDELSNRSFPQYLGGTSRQRWFRELLRTSMAAEGFSVYETEWWHFDFNDWQQFPISNQPFSAIR